MNKGIIYFNQGTKCLTRLCVSIHSLRKVYNGAVTVIHVGDVPDSIRGYIARMGCAFLNIPATGEAPLVRKAQMWRYSPYDLTMFIDADTLIVGRVDEYFHLIAEYGFCTGWFAGWKTTGGTMSGRIKAMEKCTSKEEVLHALEYGYATNTGIFGFKKDHAILPAWEKLTREAHKSGCSPIPDELACQMLLPYHRHWLAPIKWGVSVNKSSEEHYADMRIIHYHGRKHVRELPICSPWKQEFKAVLRECPEVAEYADRRLRRYMGEKRETTLVTAVDAKYLLALKKNYEGWMTIPQLVESPAICFYDVKSVKPEELDFFEGEKIPWDYDAPTQRARMLACFVLGVPNVVKTKYWMKVDADSVVKKKFHDFRINREIRKSHLTGHKWGYTKSKAREGELHFLNALDKWWKGEPIFPPNIPPDSRYGHPRIASYFCIQTLKLSEKVATLCDGKMPVPSHDTLVWYVAHRLGWKITRANFKKWITA